MIEVRQTGIFRAWLAGLRDNKARVRIDVRLQRLEKGHAGDVKPVGSGVSELRIDYGPGYRMYFVQRGKTVVILLCGGDKRTQAADIKQAIRLAQELQRDGDRDHTVGYP
jgi:putative addiction module killer protein